MRKKKLKFGRQQSRKKKSFRGGWRKPKGIQSKKRLRRRGHGLVVRIGYRRAKDARGLDREGMKKVVVDNVDMLKDVDKSKEKIVIGGSVGLKKKIILVNKARELGLIVANVKDVEGFLKSSEERLEKKKGERVAKKKRREEKKKEAIKKKEEKEAKEKEKGKERGKEKEEEKEEEKGEEKSEREETKSKVGEKKNESKS